MRSMLKQLRIKQGYTQEKLASSINIHELHIQILNWGIVIHLTELY